MANPVDLAELRRAKARVGNLKSRELRALVEGVGYQESRTKGGHYLFTKAGVRTIVVPKTLTSGTAFGIINRLIGELEA